MLVPSIFVAIAAASVQRGESSTLAFVAIRGSRGPYSDSRSFSRHLPLDAKISTQETPLSEDEIAVKEQLGYVPSNFVKVTSRTAVGNKPVAIQTYPLNGGAVRRKSKAKGSLTPFPTLYWLCCPDISRAVADLERRGYVGVLEERLRSNNEYVEKYIAAHTMYAEERWQSLTKEDRDMLERVARGDADDIEKERITVGMVDMIRYSGIAGRARPFEPCIKCLHSHYAHYRSGNSGEFNVVGMWTDELLREEFSELDL